MNAHRAAEGATLAEGWHHAARAGHVETLALRLAEGQRVDARDSYGQTALMVAARLGHCAAVELLIAHGASLDMTAKYGLSALMLAVINRHASVARQLVAAGADLSIRGTGAPGFAGKTARAIAEDSGQPDLAAAIAAQGGP